MDIKEKIENMKPFHMWLLFVLLYVSFSTEVLWRPFIFAEDTLFLNNALTDGVKSLFYRHAEYWEMISRLTANIAIFLGRGANSYLVTTFVMKAVAIAIFSYYILYFAIADFSWLVKERWQRFLISFIVLVWFGNFFNSYYNITNIHWTGEFFVFLVGLNLVINRKFPGVLCVIMCLLTCMQSPEACILTVPFAIYIFDRIREKKICFTEMLVYILVVMTAFLQFYVIKKSSNGVHVTDINHIFSVTPKTLISVLSVSSYVFGNEVVSYLSPALRMLLGAFVWIFLIYSCIKINRIYIAYFVLYVAVFLFLHYTIIHIKPLDSALSYVDSDIWIHSCPAAVVALTFFCIVKNCGFIWDSSAIKLAALLFSTIILVSQISHAGKISDLSSPYKSYDYNMLGMWQIEETNKEVDFNSNNYKKLKLYAGWDLLIPVR